jgi:hypothetical protein
MDLYYGTELPKHVLDSLLKIPREQFGFHLGMEQTIEEIVEGINEACSLKDVYIVYESGILLFFTNQTPYILRMDSVREENSSIFAYTKVIKKVVKLFTEKTEIHKLETRTPFKELDILAKRCKWDHEGTFKESYLMQDGSFADELSFGIILRRKEMVCP